MRPVGATLMDADRQTGRYDEANRHLSWMCLKILTFIDDFVFPIYSKQYEST